MPRVRKDLLATTGRGDDGTTGLLGGSRIGKDDALIEAYGTVDEASSALGLARALTADARVSEICEELQRGLYRLGAALATRPGREGAFGRTEAADVERLEAIMAELEAQAPMPDGFILPGATPASAALDLARTVTRRAERRSVGLRRSGALGDPEAPRYLNRLSLLLFVLGRFEESRSGVPPKMAREPG
ncbi:MAG: cob(I)yrinic acid a,c-diamide adenosyltransferase [Candidatus Dormibacteraceae bacterium]